MGTISHLPRRERAFPCRLESEEAAEAAASALASAWLQPGHCLHPAERREALRLSGLLGISLSVDVEGIDCSNVTLARVLSLLEPADRLAADALESHYTLLESFRFAEDDKFYHQLAERVVAGDLLFSALDEDRLFGPGRLTVTAGDLSPRASGGLRLSASAGWADWLWVPCDGVNDTSGAALISARSGLYQAIAETGGILEWDFGDVPAAYAQWGSTSHHGTDASLTDLLYAARLQGSLKAGSADPFNHDPFQALRLSAGLDALEALVEKSALFIDQAQVSNSAETVSIARIHALKAAVFAADLAGDIPRLQRLAENFAALNVAG